MRFDELKTGTRLELELLDNLDEKVSGPYVSQLLEPVSDQGMAISTPITESRLLFVPLNLRLRVTFFNRKYGFMGFIATVEARESKGNISALIIKAQTELQKIQRRKHYRLNCILGCEFKILSSLQENIVANGLNKAAVKNLSGSGACIVTDMNVPAKSIIELFIDINPTSRISALCIVIRRQVIEVKKSDHYELGLYFTEISQKDQDLVIKFIFEQQRMQLKKDVLEK